MSTAKPEKIRLDKLVYERGLAPSRERAEALIMAGRVLVNDVPHTKPGHKISSDSEIRVRGINSAFVGRGGDKIAPALQFFQIDPSDIVAVDIGASTGGFTDCLLQAGARRVYAVDVGSNQLDWKLRSDPRVEVLEQVNAKDLLPAMFSELPTLAVIDVSFIGLRKVLEAVLSILSFPATIVALVKPQFELGPEYVGKGGVVRDVAHQQLAVQLVCDFAATLGLHIVAEAFPSPLKGEKKGNQEYFVCLRHETA